MVARVAPNMAAALRDAGDALLYWRCSHSPARSMQLREQYALPATSCQVACFGMPVLPEAWLHRSAEMSKCVEPATTKW